MTKKAYCYKSECKAVLTGFQWNDIKSCSYCKCELEDSLYDRIKDKEKKKEIEVDDEYYTTWNYQDPMGD